jgi:amidohydrolase
MTNRDSDFNRDIWNEVDSVCEETVQIRRHIHQNPEISGCELKTASFINSKLSDIGIQSKKYIDETAVVGTIRNGKGPTIVLRADIDALPIQEDTGLPYSSINPGVMHACGHDFHAACLLGASKVLHKMRSHWSGTLVLLFQPQEEIEPGGATALIECGAFPSAADAVFGLHVNAEHECGTVGIKKGLDYAGVLAFDVVIKGKGGHGGTPENAIDPILCASHLILQLQTLISREKSPFFPAVLTVGSFHAGTRRNIIPETAVFSGTIRCHLPEYLNSIQQRIIALVASTGLSYRCESVVTFETAYPPVNNDPSLSDQFIRAFSALAGGEKCIERPLPTMYAEDFAYYQEKVPGVYIHLGVRPKRKKNVPMLHSPHFSPDESAISTGIASHVCFALDFLRKDQNTKE